MAVPIKHQRVSYADSLASFGEFEDVFWVGALDRVPRQTAQAFGFRRRRNPIQLDRA
jgi:hypothetical protein